jgi:hypothetical protein
MNGQMASLAWIKNLKLNCTASLLRIIVRIVMEQIYQIYQNNKLLNVKLRAM